MMGKIDIEYPSHIREHHDAKGSPTKNKNMECCAVLCKPCETCSLLMMQEAKSLSPYPDIGHLNIADPYPIGIHTYYDHVLFTEYQNR